MAKNAAKLIDPMTVDFTDNDFHVGMVVVVHPEKGAHGFDYGIKRNKPYPIKGRDPMHWYLARPDDPDINVYFDARDLVPFVKIEAYQAALSSKSIQPAPNKSPATLEAESLAKRLERFRELIRVEGEISAHKVAGEALTERRAALVAELYPECESEAEAMGKWAKTALDAMKNSNWGASV